MQGSFSYDNPTRLHFGPEAMDRLAPELSRLGSVVQLAYGTGSAKRNGVLDQVLGVLEALGKTVVEDGGVASNPTIERVRQGVALARERGSEALLAVGGGSVCDYAKVVAASVHLDEDPWEKYYARAEGPDPGQRLLPVGCVVTMSGTGSEMNGTSVLTNAAAGVKKGCRLGPGGHPRFAILDPRLTFSVPRYHMVSGVYDVFCHLCEQYFAGEADCVSDYLAEGLMRSIVASGSKAVANPRDYEARSNIMWAAAWALNGLMNRGKPETDWFVHKLGHAVAVHTGAAHGMTLAAVTPAYYRFLLPHGAARFARFAERVWGLARGRRTELELAEAGLKTLEAWMRELGLVMSLSELGVTEEKLPAVRDSVILKGGGYRLPTREEVEALLRESM